MTIKYSLDNAMLSIFQYKIPIIAKKKIVFSIFLQEKTVMIQAKRLLNCFHKDLILNFIAQFIKSSSQFTFIKLIYWFSFNLELPWPGAKAISVSSSANFNNIARLVQICSSQLYQI